ncbi:MAG: site-2 protease family protein [Bacilli bacterium]|nr:site-2 protease family protein [Bacilli bacterium]MDD7314428.1 site-2 protease family protein [Bacilli bacterium]MDY4053154.1 site-2 protease family protein [Bacilli bacterium]
MIEYLYVIPAALIAIVLHELGHGLVSYMLGDPTPKNEGRLTLNPLKHLDPIGTLCLILCHFGWAKPVSVDPTYYKKPKLGMTLVGLAGPMMNFLVAILSFVFIGILMYIRIYVVDNTFIYILYNFFSYLSIINIGLGVFNLIPIPPLDGSKVIGVILPNKAYEEYMGYQKYGMYFMIFLMILLSVLDYFGVESPISFVIEKIYNFFINIILKIIIK